MSFIKELKAHEHAYDQYREIRSILKNYFHDIKTNTASKKKVTFRREDVKITYVVTGDSKNPSFHIVQDRELIMDMALTKKNEAAIKAAIDETAPSSLNKQCMAFNARLSNAYSRARFDEAYLLGMAEWKTATLDDSPLTVQIDDNYVYKGDSKAEIKILTYLLKHGCVKLLRGQDYVIEYGSRRYYPDFVYLNHLNQIVILEVKAKGNFSSEKNLIKYIALAKHCEAHGYVYGMIDANFNTLVSLLNAPINKTFEKELLRAVEEYGMVNSQLITQIRSQHFPHIKRRALEHMIPRIVITNRLVNKPRAVHDLNIVNKRSKLKHYYLLLQSIK